MSLAFSREAWRLLDGHFERALEAPGDLDAVGSMQLGAHLAGCAIENSMLGAAHACANPLTARYNVVHGHAVGVMLPHVVRFNSEAGDHPYSDLSPDPEALAARLTTLLTAAEIPTTLRDHGVKEFSLDDLADMASKQWTATFNPRKL